MLPIVFDELRRRVRVATVVAGRCIGMHYPRWLSGGNRSWPFGLRGVSPGLRYRSFLNDYRLKAGRIRDD